MVSIILNLEEKTKKKANYHISLSETFFIRLRDRRFFGTLHGGRIWR